MGTVGDSRTSTAEVDSSTSSGNTKNPPNRAVIPPYMKAVSGSLGGMVEAGCLQPIDVIKTRLQLDRVGQYRGIAHCGTTIAKTEGVRALWKGLTPFATHLTLKYTLRMGTNAVLQAALADSQTGKLSNASRMMAGFGAGVLEALVIVTPFEYEKHQAKKDPEHAHRHKIEEEIAAAAAVGSGGYAFHEHHEKKEDKKEAEEASGKKHHHLI